MGVARSAGMRVAVMAMAVMAMAVVAGLSAVTARGQQESQVNAGPPAFVTADVFPIFPWDILPTTKAAYEEARDCGFNLAGFVHAENLDLVQAAGLKCFVADPQVRVRGNEKATDEEIEQRVKALAEKTAKHPATFGYHIVDEPSQKLVPTVIRWAKAFEAAAPNAVAYTNFFPIGVTQSEADYEKYLATYVDAVKPRAFSFDHYSMMDDGSVRPKWFECLECVRRVALKTGVPFWNVCLANCHFRYADPSPATLRFQAYTSLAYGARGIGWFTYTGRDRGNYRNAAIDLDGHRTPTWEMLRDVNMQLQRLAPEMVKLKSTGVFHSPDVPMGCRGIAESGLVAELKGTSPMCVGEFQDEQGRPALLIVNRDLQHSTHVAFTLKQKSKVLRVSALTGQTRPWGAEDDWLPPGGGILLLLRPE